MTFEKIKYYYDLKLWTSAIVKIAVRKGIITKEQYKEVTGQDYV